MVNLEKSAFYQEILAKGIKIGIEQSAVEQGIKRGIKQERINIILRIIGRRLNYRNEGWRVRLTKLPLDTLDELVEVALDVDSVAEFESTWMEIENSLFDSNK